MVHIKAEEINRKKNVSKQCEKRKLTERKTSINTVKKN